MWNTTYDEVVGNSVNYSKKPCNRVPCCEACKWSNKYQLEHYNKLICTWKGGN